MADRNKIGIPAGPVPCGAEEAGELRCGDRLHGEGQRLIFELTGAGAKAPAPFASSRCSRARGTAAASAAFKHFPKENLGEAGLCLADQNQIRGPRRTGGPVGRKKQENFAAEIASMVKGNG